LASFVSVAVDPEARLGYVSYVNKEGRAGIYKLDVRRPGAPPIPFTTIRGSSRLGAIALDPKRRRLLVADAVGGSVYAVDLAKGNPLTFARKVGKVAALAVDVNKERLLVAEATRGQILAFGLDSPSDRRGVPLPFKGSQGLRGLTIDTRGTLWVADMDKGTVAQLAMDGSQMATLGP
jgi:sugar lactone lactonase YvrE